MGEKEQALGPKTHPNFALALSSLLKENMAARPGERVIFLSDTAPFVIPDPGIPDRETLCFLAETAAKTLRLSPRSLLYPPTHSHGAEPPRKIFEELFPSQVLDYIDKHELWERLYAKSLTEEEILDIERLMETHPPSFDILLSFSRYSLTHTRFRRFLTASKTVRVATMPGVEPRMFLTVMQADWERVRLRSLRVAELLSSAERAQVITASEYTFEVSLEGRRGIADTGIIADPGSYGNLPGGEGFIAPQEGTAEGKIACGPPEKPCERVLLFHRGEVQEIEGPSWFRDKFLQAFERYPLARSLAELGVGTNEKAEDTENILEAEKILGTVHIALGDNLGFGGIQSVPFHQDIVIFKPTLILFTPQGKVTVLKEGEWNLPD